MTTTTTEPTLDRRAADYLAAVRDHLSDLPPDERDDLLDDLESHVHEVAATTDGPLDDALGPPSSFAAELRASAGLAPAAGAPRPPLDRLRRRTDALRRHPWTRAVVDFLPELRPAWWVARGWLLVWLAAEATGGDSSWFPLPELWGNAFLGLIVTVPVVAWSVRLGRNPAPPRWRWVVNACAVLGALVMVGGVGEADAAAGYVTVDDLGQDRIVPNPAGAGASDFAILWWPDGSPITDLDAYGADGQPADGITLVDQDGRTLDLGPARSLPPSPDPAPRVPPRVEPGAAPTTSTSTTGSTTTVPVPPVPAS